MRRISRSSSAKLDNVQADKARRQTNQQIAEIQRSPFISGRLIENVELPDGVNVTVYHNLGKRVSFFVSPPRDIPTTTGRFTDRTEETELDRRKAVVVRASGWGKTVHVDIMVF